MKVDAALVTHVTKLARLRLAPDEAVRLEHDLERILTYVEELQTVDTHDVEPMVHGEAHLGTRLAPDVPVPSLSQADALANAPVVAEGAFVVPRVVGG